MDIPALLDTLKTHGITVTVSGGCLKLVPGSRVPQDLAETLRKHKAEVLEYLRTGKETASLFELPFPLGYGGLPKTQVALAEVVNANHDSTVKTP